MKKLLLSIALLPASLLALAADPAVAFETTSHDFGNISEGGGNVSYEFKFTNTGDAPLMILTANASCGCTRPNFPKKPVEPGKSETIKVTYVPAGRPGEFHKTVTVKTNAKKQRQVTLKISGVVLPND